MLGFIKISCEVQQRSLLHAGNVCMWLKLRAQRDFGEMASQILILKYAHTYIIYIVGFSNNFILNKLG